MGRHRSEAHGERGALVALGDELEEEARLLAPQGQAADPVDDQEAVDARRAVHGLLELALSLRGLEHRCAGRPRW